MSRRFSAQFEMTGPQVTAALGLLKKTLPDLSATELKNGVEFRNDYAIPAPDTFEEWKEYVESTRRKEN